MKKKILALCLIVVLAVTAVTGATLAYFTDTEAATNVMTVGNIDITLEEKTYEDGEWKPFDEDQVLYPITQAKAPFNKNVFTYNTSESGEDVYIRTIITLDAELYDYVGLSFNSGSNYTYADGTIRYAVDWEYAGDFSINGDMKSVFVCTVKDGAAVAENDYVYSLCKVWLYETVTQEQVEALNLTTFPVEVLSQGIQSEGLTHAEAMEALGAINAENLSEWFA